MLDDFERFSVITANIPSRTKAQFDSKDLFEGGK
jgi:hypothetical protein